VISPNDPIRRDGETLLHGNCWMRRAQQALRAGVIAGGQNGTADRVTVIRAKLRAGTLPTATPTRTWAGYSEGGLCDACGDRIPVGNLGYTIDFADSPSLRVHPECLGVWQTELKSLGRRISGGSAA
jgi:hypothetical protein